MIIQDQPAYLLHRRAYRNTSLILDAFTPGSGRVALVAPGARARRPGRGVLLEPFTPLLLNWRGSGEMKTLSSADQTGGAITLSGPALAAGLYLNELLIKLLPREDAHPALFVKYGESLHGLRGDSMALQAALRRFEKQLLDELGVGLILDRDAGGASIDPARQYVYEPEAGPRIAHTRASRSGPFLQGASLIALHDDVLERPEVLRDLRRLTTMVLNHHLGGRPLRSRELLSAIWSGSQRRAGKR